MCNKYVFPQWNRETKRPFLNFLTRTLVMQLTQHISDGVNIQNITQAYLHILSFLSNTI